MKRQEILLTIAIALLAVYIRSNFSIGPRGGHRAPFPSSLEIAQEMVAQGWNLETQGKLPEALLLYNQATVVDSHCAPAYEHRAMLSARQGAFKTALNEFAKAIELAPREASGYVQRGKLYFGMGNNELAAADFTKAMELNPREAQAIHYLALTYAAQNKNKESLEQYDRYLSLAPTDNQAYRERARLHWVLGHSQDSLADYTHAIALNPKDQEAYEERIRILLAQKKFTKALEDYSTLMELDPANMRYLAKRIQVYEELGKPDLAQKDRELIRAKDPGFYKNWLLHQGAIELSIGDWDKAQKDFDEAIAMDPNGPALYEQRGRLDVFKKDFILALADLDKAVELNSKDPSVYNFRAMIHAQKKDWDLALRDLNQALILNPRYANGYMNRARIYLEKGEYERSWSDVAQVRTLGAALDEQFLQNLQEKSGQKDSGREPLSSASDAGRSSDSFFNEIRLGQNNEPDSLFSTWKTIHVHPPAGWKKETKVNYPGGQALLQYSRSAQQAIPRILLSVSEFPHGMSSIQEYAQTVKEFMQENSPSEAKVTISEPKLENRAGRNVAYLEFFSEGHNGIKYRFAWYQIPFEKVILTVQYHNTDYQFPEDFLAFQRLVDSLEFQERDVNAAAPDFKKGN